MNGNHRQWHSALLCTLLLALPQLDAAGTEVVLSSAVAHGIGDGDGSPFLYAFESAAPRFEFTLLEMDDYEALGLAVSDTQGFVLEPLIHNPGRNMTGTFHGTTGSYVAHVSGIGDGAFGLQVVAIPEPATWLILSAALTSIAVCRVWFDRQAARKSIG